LYISGIYNPYTCAAGHLIVSLLPVFLLYVSNVVHCPYGQALRFFFPEARLALGLLENLSVLFVSLIALEKTASAQPKGHVL